MGFLPPDLQASPFLSVLPPLLRSVLPHSEPWLLFYPEVSECFFPSQLDGSVLLISLRKASFMASQGTQVIWTSSPVRIVLSEEPWCRGPAKVLPPGERERMLLDRLRCALHFLKVASFHPYSATLPRLSCCITLPKAAQLLRSSLTSIQICCSDATSLPGVSDALQHARPTQRSHFQDWKSLCLESPYSSPC